MSVSVSVCGSADHSSISGRFRWQQSKLDGRSGATLPCLHANQRFNSIPLLLSAFLSFFLSFFLSLFGDGLIQLMAIAAMITGMDLIIISVLRWAEGRGWGGGGGGMAQWNTPRSGTALTP